MRAFRMTSWIALLTTVPALLPAAAIARTTAESAVSTTPAPSPSQKELTLKEALALAEQRNLSLSSARLQLEKADAQVRQAWAGILPVVGMSATWSHLDHADELDPSAMTGGIPTGVDMDPIVIRQQDSLSGAMSVQLPLVNLPAWLGIRTAKAAKELTGASVEQVRQAILYGTARAWYVALMSRSLVTLQEDQIESAQHHLEVAQQKEAVGSGLRIDVLRAQTDLEQALQDLEDARLSLETACDALGILTGKGGLPLPAAAEPIAEPDIDERTLERDAREQRQDLVVLKQSEALSRKQLRGAWMSLLPSLNAVWQGTHQFTEMSDMGDPDKSRWTAMVTLSIPLFDWRSWSSIRVQRMALEQASAQFAEAEQTAGKEVRQARREYLSALREKGVRVHVR